MNYVACFQTCARTSLPNAETAGHWRERRAQASKPLDALERRKERSQAELGARVLRCVWCFGDSPKVYSCCFASLLQRTQKNTRCKRLFIGLLLSGSSVGPKLVGSQISTSDRTHARKKADTLNTEKESHIGRTHPSKPRGDTTAPPGRGKMRATTSRTTPFWIWRFFAIFFQEKRILRRKRTGLVPDRTPQRPEF